MAFHTIYLYLLYLSLYDIVYTLYSGIDFMDPVFDPSELTDSVPIRKKPDPDLIRQKKNGFERPPKKKHIENGFNYFSIFT